MNDFSKIQKNAMDEWQALQDSSVPVIYVGMGSCGLASGAGKVWDKLQSAVTEKKIKAKLVKVGCIGPCYMEPLVDIRQPGLPRMVYSNVDEIKTDELIAQIISGKNGKVKPIGHLDEKGKEIEGLKSFWDLPMLKGQERIVLRNCGIINPENIGQYIANGGFTGLLKAFEKAPEGVIAEVKESGIRGRGGAGFPTFRKWQFCRAAAGKVKYLICNADEGDPGAFMNRSLIEGDPFALLEGMLIAAYAIGANHGYIYIRAEYPLAIERLRIAIEQMSKNNLIGNNILDTGFSFDIRLKEGAGAFVCGEETALIASIEGQRGMPRSRPPFPAVSGLKGKPTIINNVETLATIPNILREGGKWYSQFGTETSKGTKTFALVGKVRRTGLIEVPIGITLREIIFNIGGGTQRPFKAVQTGGPSGGCLSKDCLDLPVDYESLTAAGSIMGSGGLIVMDEDNCMVDIARYFLSFTSNESCGKCSPCRVGTKRMVEILDRITHNEAQENDIALLETIAQTVKNGSLCGLGQTAANPVLTTLRYFRDEYKKHIINKKCDAFVCNKLVGAPCQSACPLGTEVWRYVAQIAHGNYEDAYMTIRTANPFPSICARVCNHPCEDKCRSGTTGGQNIAIRSLKRFVTEKVDPVVFTPPKFIKASETSLKVAVIGAGPAGITAAHYLSLEGYKVTIFDTEKEPGGMLYTCIPKFRLSKDILKNEINSLLNENIALKCNTTFGKDMTMDSLFVEGYNAVFLAIGAHKSWRLGVEGEDTEGVYSSLDFLKSYNLKDVNLAKGNVVVIGGGNTALDTARVAIRQKGVNNVTILYRRTRVDMPAMQEDVESALEEGIKLETLISLETLITPKKIHSKDGKLTGIECLRNELGDFDSSARRKPIPVPGTEYIIPLDCLIIAIGEAPLIDDISAMGLNISKWGTVEVDPETLATNRKGVFAGGDVVTGPNTVVDAVATGKKAAVMIGRYLRKEDLKKITIPALPAYYIDPVVNATEESVSVERIQTPTLPVNIRKKSLTAEVELPPTEDEAKCESKRCLRCDLEFTKPVAKEKELVST